MLSHINLQLYFILKELVLMWIKNCKNTHIDSYMLI